MRTQKGLLPPELNPSGGGSSTSPLSLPLVLKPGGLVLAAITPKVSPYGEYEVQHRRERVAGWAWLLLGLPGPLHVWRQERGIVLLQLNIGLGLVTHSSNVYIKMY